MVTFLAIVREILLQRSPRRALIEQNRLGQALFLQRSRPAIRIGVQIRTSRRYRDRLDSARSHDGSERRSVFRIPVMQQLAPVTQKAPSFHCHVPGDPLHLLLVRMQRDAGDFQFAACQLNGEQHKEWQQPALRQYLNAHEVLPASTALRDRMSCAHVVALFLSGAGNILRRSRMLPTWSDTLWPRLAKAPAIRSWPQSALSLTMRTMSCSMGRLLQRLAAQSMANLAQHGALRIWREGSHCPKASQRKWRLHRWWRDCPSIRVMNGELLEATWYWSLLLRPLSWKS